MHSKYLLLNVSRGGLMKPSDVVYITCTLAYTAYKSIKNCEAYQFLVNSSNPRNVFVTYFMNSVTVEGSNALEPIMKSERQNEHLFSSFAPKMIGIFLISYFWGGGGRWLGWPATPG